MIVRKGLAVFLLLVGGGGLFGAPSGYRALRLTLGPESHEYSLNSRVSTGVGDFHLGSSDESWDSAWALHGQYLRSRRSFLIYGASLGLAHAEAREGTRKLVMESTLVRGYLGGVLLNRPSVTVEVLPFLGAGHSRLSFESGPLSTTMEGYVLEAGGDLNLLYRGMARLDIGFGVGLLSRQNRFSEGLAGGSTLDVDIDAGLVRVFCIAGFRL